MLRSLMLVLMFLSAVVLVTLAALTWSATFVAIPLAVCCGLVGWVALRAASDHPHPDLLLMVQELSDADRSSERRR